MTAEYTEGRIQESYQNRRDLQRIALNAEEKWLKILCKGLYYWFLLNFFYLKYLEHLHELRD